MQIKVNQEDINTLITFIEAKEEPEKIVNFIRAYIFDDNLAITK